MQAIATIEEAVRAASSPVPALASLKARSGRPVVGSASSWVPVEIVEALGASLFRVPLLPGKISHAAAHLQSYCCGYGKGILELALSGGLGSLDAMVFPSLCDTVQNLADIWALAVPAIPAVGLYVPVNMASAGAAPFLETELRRTMEALSRALGKSAGDEDLEKAIETWRERRRLVRSFYDRKREGASTITATEAYGLLFASDFLSTDDLRRLTADLESRPEKKDADGVEVFLVGTGFPFPGFFRLLDGLSIRVVDDYICGGRAFWGYDDEPDRAGGEAPLAAVARGLLQRVEGATRLRGPGEGASVLERIRASGARHVLWVTQKFCDPWGWQLGAIREKLEKAGTRVFALEMSGIEGEEGTLRTRLEAYVETVRMGDEYFDT
jgi:benzoyl-CoA reductase/2-hydroxyglutaryl-CoA dehydratase subunit BcrC/BadD/HgdB